MYWDLLDLQSKVRNEKERMKKISYFCHSLIYIDFLRTLVPFDG